MATVTQLLDRGSLITGLRSVVGSRERSMALQALNNAYMRAVSDADVGSIAYTRAFGFSNDYYAFSFLQPSNVASPPYVITPIMKFTHVYINTQGGKQMLDQVSMQQLLDMRATNDAVGVPVMYAVDGFDNIAFYPNPSTTDVFTIHYVAYPKELVETVADATLEEATPTSIPRLFHWDVLLPGMAIELFDKDQRPEDVQFWMQRYEKGIARLQQFAGESGGSANRMYIGPSSGGMTWNDERSRR